MQPGLDETATYVDVLDFCSVHKRERTHDSKKGDPAAVEQLARDSFKL